MKSRKTFATMVISNQMKDCVNVYQILGLNGKIKNYC